MSLREGFRGERERYPHGEKFVVVGVPSDLAPSHRLLRVWERRKGMPKFNLRFWCEVSINPKAVKHLKEIKTWSDEGVVRLLCDERHPPCVSSLVIKMVREIDAFVDSPLSLVLCPPSKLPAFRVKNKAFARYIIGTNTIVLFANQYKGGEPNAIARAVIGTLLHENLHKAVHPITDDLFRGERMQNKRLVRAYDTGGEAMIRKMVEWVWWPKSDPNWRFPLRRR